MLTQHAQPTARPFALVATIFVFLMHLLAATDAQAQRTRPANTRVRDNENALRTWSRDNMAKQADKAFEKQRISLLPQIRDDFARMQHVNNEMMRAVFQANALDYKTIHETTAEIRKRASRLKANLRLPEGDEQAPQPSDSLSGKNLKESLLLLDNAIMSFVTNPLFQKTQVLDAKLSTKASRDLRSIIEMSTAIRRNVERAGKSSAPRQSPATPR